MLVGIVTTSRADYGIYKPVLDELRRANISFGLYVTGMHLQQQYGRTIKYIKQDQCPILAQVPCVMKESNLGIALAMGDITKGMAKAFLRNRPDILFVLGDRYEMHASAVAAVACEIPLAHIHGGEITRGSMDEYFRHSITKMAHLHFASTVTYAKRIIQMGEHPTRVFTVGAPGLDHVRRVKQLSLKEFGNKFGIDLQVGFMLVTFHPEVSNQKMVFKQVNQLISALSEFKNHDIVVTAPNADPASFVIREQIKKFIQRNRRVFYIDNLGVSGYVNALRLASVMVGNSSSGIIEAASFKLPVVNIGSRQEGRLCGKNVIHVNHNADEIRRGINLALSDRFRQTLKRLINCYGHGDSGQRIVEVLRKINVKDLRAKVFYE